MPVPPRRLVLVRHAQAADAPVDADRPLTGHGARRATAIGGWLEHAGVVPDLVLVSPARRTQETWERAGGRAPVVEPGIYTGSVDAVLAAITGSSDDVQQLVVVGHNPSISFLTALLDDGSGDPAARRAVDVGFPPGGVAVLAVDTPFAALAPGAARLELFAVPGQD